MKRGTELKLKFKRLMARMSISSWKAKGLLTALWDFTAENAPLGDIGRFSNEDIAIGIDYAEGDPDELIAALTETGWLDQSQNHRLVVHDWHDHCEDWLKKRVERAKQRFASETVKEEPQQEAPPSDNGGQRQTASDSGGLPEPSLAKPEPEPPSTADADAPSIEPAVEAMEAWSERDRGHRMNTSEHADVWRRLEAMPEEAAVFPEAVKACRSGGTRFKSVAYAMKSAMNKLGEMAETSGGSAREPPRLTAEAVWDRGKSSFRFDGVTKPKPQVAWDNERGLIVDGAVWAPVNRLREVEIDPSE